MAFKAGLEGVIVGETTISKVDPIKVQLTYRGYDAVELANKSSYEEVVYLLLYGELPNKRQLSAFNKKLKDQRKLPLNVVKSLKASPSKNTMNVLRTGVSLLGHNDNKGSSHKENVDKAISLIAKTPTIIACAYRIGQSKKLVSPKSSLSHAANFLYMLNGKKPSKEHEQAMNAMLVMYAEHGFNASTFAARVTTGTRSDYYSAITSAVGTLKGPLHGGANEAAMKMFLKIKDPKKAKSFVTQALKKHQLIMGIGHRVYKKGDPRVHLGFEFAQWLATTKTKAKLFAVARVVSEEMKKKKKMLPNVDFYSALVYYFMGLPMSVYTPLFAMARVAGWSAHIIEQHDHNRLIRPLPKYVGRKPRKFIPLNKR